MLENPQQIEIIFSTHHYMILGASSVQKFSTPCVKRYGVILRTCRGGQIVFKSSFNIFLCQNMQDASLESDEIHNIDSSAVV